MMTKMVLSQMTKAEEKETHRSSYKTKSKPSSLGKRRKDSSNKNVAKDLALTTKGYERHHVKHNYHDYARSVTVPNPLELEMEAKASGGVNNPFPTILHKLLSETSTMGFADVISWQPHGRSFLIHKPKEFVRDVVPRYFKHSKLSSFQRQLSLYGFVRLTNESPDKGSYYHELFLRGRAFLCSKIQRTRVKGTWVRTSSSPESEPDFRSMDPVADLRDIISGSLQQQQQQQTPTSRQANNYVSPKSSPLVSGVQEDSFQPQLQQQPSMEKFHLDGPETMPSAINSYVPPPFNSAPLHMPPFLSSFSLPAPISAVSSLDSLITPVENRDESAFQQEPQLHHHQKWLSCDIPSLTSLGRAISYPVLFEDDELGSFLRDVDLGFELEKAEDLLVHTAMT